MEILIISYFLIFLAGFFNAVMDTLDHHFTISIFEYDFFRKRTKLYRWLKSNWLIKYKDENPGLGYWTPIPWFWDGWHCAKENMVAAFVGNTLITGAWIAIYGLGFTLTWWNGLAIVAGYIVVWYLSFTIFYKTVLLQKSYRNPFTRSLIS